ncbi:MAG: hypothetical protein ACXVCY_18385 [Pseudobdellovibrionaceae bacterium]
MKKMLAILSLMSISSTVLAAPILRIEKVKSIICAATAYHEEDTPNEKTPAQGTDFKIFTAGSRRDVKPAPGAFILAEYSLDQKNDLNEEGNQQFYFSQDKTGKITFKFIADWKANGELTLDGNETAKGFINQKSHITELSCLLKK